MVDLAFLYINFTKIVIFTEPKSLCMIDGRKQMQMLTYQ